MAFVFAERVDRKVPPMPKVVVGKSHLAQQLFDIGFLDSAPGPLRIGVVLRRRWPQHADELASRELKLTPASTE